MSTKIEMISQCNHAVNIYFLFSSTGRYVALSVSAGRNAADTIAPEKSGNRCGFPLSRLS